MSKENPSLSLALASLPREVSTVTESSAHSAAEIRKSVREYQLLIVCSLKNQGMMLPGLVCLLGGTRSFVGIIAAPFLRLNFVKSMP